MFVHNYAFIDSQNLNLSVISQGWRLDFKKFRTYLADKYKVTRAFMFLGYISNYAKLYQDLRESGYEVVFKEVILDKQLVKVNVDVDLAVFCMKELQNFYKAVVVSGDGDFLSLVKYLEEV